MNLENQNSDESNFLKSSKKFKEAGFLKAQQIAKIGNYGWDRNSNQVFWSDELFRIFEYNPQITPASFEAFIKLIHPEDLSFTFNSLEESVKNKKVFFNNIHRLLMPDGRIKYVEENNETEYSLEGNPVFTHGTVQDITDRMIVSENLRRNQLMMERAEHNAQMGSWEWDIANDVITWSKELFLLHQIDPIDGVPNYGGLFQFFEKEDGIRLNTAVENAVKYGIPYSLEIRIHRKDGTKRVCIATGLPEKNTTGKVVRLVGSLQDITDQKNIEENLRASESKYRLLFENINAGIAIFDPLGNFLLVNEQYAQLLYSKPSDFIGRSLGEMIPNRSELYYQRLFKVVKEKKGAFFEDKIPTKTGFIWLSSQLHPNIDSKGDVVEVQFVTFSITMQKEAEEALIKLNTELEGRVEHRTAELRAARDEAELANRAKSLFLANMSHEIRTPLNGALGMLNLILRTELNKRQNDYVSKAQVSAQTLLGIINNILDFSKIESGKMELDLHPFNLVELIQRLAILSADYFKDKNIDILFDVSKNIPILLIGDELRLRQVLLNLIGNGIKFTKNGEVTLKIKEIWRDFNSIKLEFSVTDTGIGIPENKLQHIFEGFSQAESSTTREYGGTGLGLAISTRMVKLMGGEIQVQSELGKGSCFSFSISLKIGENPPFPMQKSLSKIKLLVVDDNAHACLIIEGISENLGWDCQSLSDGFKINEYLSKENKIFDVCLIDYNMPKLNGIEIIKQIKSHNSFKNIPVLLMLTSNEHELLHKNQKEDLQLFDSYLIKPITSVNLLEIVKPLTEKMNKNEFTNTTNINEVVPEYFKGAKVLLAEDNQINQQIVTEILNDYGLVVAIADNGKKVVELALSRQYQLILMDMQMPILDGIEASIQIRQHKELAEVPIIAMTANVSQTDRAICKHAGMNDFLPKPFEINTLVDLLKFWLDPQNGKELIKASSDLDYKSFDMTKGLRLSRGSRVSYIKLMRIFVDQHLEDGNKIKDNMKLGEKITAKFLIHNLKGSSAQIGATVLSELATELEAMLSDNVSEKEFSIKLNELIIELEILGSQIKKVLLHD